MGSLMGGWDSNTLDPKSASFERNRSLTKEEIDTFWRSKKETEEEHLRAISNLSKTIQASKNEDFEHFHNKPSTVRLARTKESLGMGVDKNLQQLINKNCWWTKSNWAFLNEPPEMEIVSNKYASQFHVANLGSSKVNPGGDGTSA